MKSFEILAFGALRELDKLYDNKLEIQSSQNWLERHAELYQYRMEYLLKPGNCSSFTSVYSELSELLTYQVFKGTCESKLLDFHHEESKSEVTLVDWLIKNEDFGLQLELFMVNTCFQYPEKTVNGYLPLIGQPNIWVKTSDYLPIVSFLNLFSTNYWETIESYAAKSAKGKNPHNREFYYGNVTKSLKEYIQSCIQDDSKDLPSD
jgi:hypothetical protein